MKLNLTNIKPRTMNYKIFKMTLLLESKFEENATGIDTVKNLQNIF